MLYLAHKIETTLIGHLPVPILHIANDVSVTHRYAGVSLVHMLLLIQL